MDERDIKAKKSQSYRLVRPEQHIRVAARRVRTILARARERLIGWLQPINMLLVKKRLRQLRKWPVSIAIMGTNLCNARCVFCSYRLQTDLKKRTLGMDEFRKVIDEYVAKGMPFQIGLTSSVADPLMDPLLLERMAYLKQIPLINYIHFTTNLIAAKKVGIENLVSSGAHRIHISIGGLDKESYERLFGVKAYSVVYSNLLELIEVNHRHGTPVGIDVIVRCDEDIKTVEQKPDFRRLRALQSTRTFALCAENLYMDWGGAINLAEFGLSPAPPLRAGKLACALLYNGPSVLADGQYMLCACKDVRNSPLAFGNAKTHSVHEVVAYRNELMDAWEKADKIPDVCRKCETYLDPTKFFGHGGDRAAIQALKSRH